MFGISKDGMLAHMSDSGSLGGNNMWLESPPLEGGMASAATDVNLPAEAPAIDVSEPKKLPYVSEFDRNQKERDEAQRKRSEKLALDRQRDKELFLIATGQKEVEVQGPIGIDGNPVVLTSLVHDENAKESQAERTLEVIDKKFNFVMGDARERFKNDPSLSEEDKENLAKVDAEKIITAGFGSKENREQIRKIAEADALKAGKDLKSSVVQTEIETHIEEEIVRQAKEFKKSNVERVFGGFVATQEVVNEYLDMETFLLLLVGDSVSSGKYGSGPKSQENRPDLGLETEIKFLKNKRLNFATAFQAAGAGYAMQTWGSGEEPADLAGVLSVIENDIMKDESKAQRFVRAFLITMGKNEKANLRYEKDKLEVIVSQIKTALQPSK